MSDSVVACLGVENMIIAEERQVKQEKTVVIITGDFKWIQTTTASSSMDVSWK
jgi:hypothetical protein